MFTAFIKGTSANTNTNPDEWWRRGAHGHLARLNLLMLHLLHPKSIWFLFMLFISSFVVDHRNNCFRAEFLFADTTSHVEL